MSGRRLDAGTVRLTHSVKRIKDRDKASGRKTRLVVKELKTPKSRGRSS